MRGRMMAEKALRDAMMALKGKKFESDDEANAFLNAALMGGAPTKEPETAREAAEDLMYTAWETEDPGRRVSIALEALEISEDCADAWTLLAEDGSSDIDEAIVFATKAVAAGKRALGPEIFEEEAGNFWMVLETRPYMRAMITLAGYQWGAGRVGEAVEIYREMLRLNPNDNQGVRDIVAMDFAEGDQDEFFGEVLEMYDEDPFATMAYGRALWLFRRDGPSPEADRALEEAFERNRHVPNYLLGRRTLPAKQSAYYSLGDTDEAIMYADRAQQGWEMSEGALEWLARQKGGSKKKKKKKR